jgi:outer membrane biosynthesis protein TonB
MTSEMDHEGQMESVITPRRIGIIVAAVAAIVLVGLVLFRGVFGTDAASTATPEPTEVAQALEPTDVPPTPTRVPPTRTPTKVPPTVEPTERPTDEPRPTAMDVPTATPRPTRAPTSTPAFGNVIPQTGGELSQPYSLYAALALALGAALLFAGLRVAGAERQ